MRLQKVESKQRASAPPGLVCLHQVESEEVHILKPEDFVN